MHRHLTAIAKHDIVDIVAFAVATHTTGGVVININISDWLKLGPVLLDGFGHDLIRSVETRRQFFASDTIDCREMETPPFRESKP
jgi:hypothetical protein